ncbi:MAG TPA: hypothetical protein VGW75_15545 [Solirubrobacteraceae bacterium]|nr:hypothetical protein [Solirubrobacteraceae bacterium]
MVVENLRERSDGKRKRSLSKPQNTRSDQIPWWFAACVVAAFVDFLASSTYLVFWQHEYIAAAGFAVLALLAITAPYWTGIRAQVSTQAGDAGVGVGVRAPAAAFDDPSVSGAVQAKADEPETRSA